MKRFWKIYLKSTLAWMTKVYLSSLPVILTANLVAEHRFEERVKKLKEIEKKHGQAKEKS